MDKIVNMRDLGGLVTQAGQKIKANKLYRAGNPGLASAADLKRLQALDLTQVIDFRGENEKRPLEKPFANAFHWVAQPIDVGNMKDLLGQQTTRDMAYQGMCDVYQKLPRDFMEQYQYFLKQAEQGQTLLYHCTAGKDRTGFATLLLLSALGVDKDTIMADYLVSNKAAQALKQQVSGFIDEHMLNSESLDPLLEVYPEYLDNACFVIDKVFGGMDRYLKDTLAVDIKAIRQHYLMD